ncbi:hypothetical protein GGR54DRAFT_353599 [Hypoxylon sp. NC1633]|nr:hypothetical protein GGR54DRAFT_353599 [Hypoxylon sp. NC1633]
MDSLKWALSRWGSSKWLLFGRLLQVSGTLVTAVMNGFLLVHIHLNRLGLTGTMFCLEMLACVAFIYSSFVLLMQHAGNRRRRSSAALITAFIVGDVFFNGMMIGIITVLAHTGLPSDCHGLTRSDFEADDAHDDPPPGFQTIRFGDKDRGISGVLDKFCPLEKGFYFVAAALVFTYMLTVTLGVLRLVERHWRNNSSIDPLFSADNIHSLGHMRPKNSTLDSSRDFQNAVPLSEGVMTPRSATSPTFPTPRVRPSVDIHRGRVLRDQVPIRSNPVSPVSAASPISQVSPVSPILNRHGSFATPPDALDTSVGGLMIGQSSDAAAEAAMVTDGYRLQPHPEMPSLPPYSPGQSRRQFMDGHGDESNEMRLSDYVKGETRAQNMKESGMGM